MPFSAEARPILAFVCNWDPHLWHLDQGASGSSLPAYVRPVRVMCAGRVDPAMVLSAFENGAEGVMVLDCGGKGCRYGPGPSQVRKVEERIKGLLNILGLDADRFTVMTCFPHEPQRLRGQMTSFARKVSGLGRSPLAR